MDFYFGLRLATPTPGEISGGVFTPTVESTNYGLLTDANIDISCKIPYGKLADPSTNSAVRFTVEGSEYYYFSDIEDQFHDQTDYFHEFEFAGGVGRANALVLYRTAGSPTSYINVHSSNDATDAYMEVLGTTTMTGPDIGWLVYDLDTSTKSYFIVNTTYYSQLEASELMIGEGILNFP